MYKNLILITSFFLSLMIYQSQAAAQTTSNFPNFPYGSQPVNVCPTSIQYATPETMLGSWAMQAAVGMDLTEKYLSPMFTTSNVVYAVGTAAIGSLLKVTNCNDGGCNQINGHCFAMQFNDKKNQYPNTPYYMIFQSVNTGGTEGNFDIYMAGGGAGAFPQACPIFWGQGVAKINAQPNGWVINIEHVPNKCDSYFAFDKIIRRYSVTYAGINYPGYKTLKNACQYATDTNFNAQNWLSVKVIPVTCPIYLTQVTGLRLEPVAIIGTTEIKDITKLQESDFNNAIPIKQTTQMQDCRTPSSGWCENNKANGPVGNYKASISASPEKPLLNWPN